ncbi:MAG: hypothetical protein WKG03_00515 [Telluria sp.]
MIRAAIIKTLERQPQAIAGRELAALASLPYKVTIDALGRMHDAGTVIRIGRKYSATWALAGTDAAQPHDAFGALEAVWRGRTPPPRGGGGQNLGRGCASLIGPSLPKNFA